MEKEIAELRKQRDLAQSRLEDFMRMIEHNVASKVLLSSHNLTFSTATDNSIPHHVFPIITVLP